MRKNWWIIGLIGVILVSLWGILGYYQQRNIERDALRFVDKVARWTFNYWRDDMLRSRWVEGAPLQQDLNDKLKHFVKEYGALAAYEGSSIDPHTANPYIMRRLFTAHAFARLEKKCVTLILYLQRKNRREFAISEVNVFASECPGVKSPVNNQ